MSDNDTAEQLDLLPPEVAEQLPETDLLHLRIADLREQVERLERRADAETHRRQGAEASRDQWIAIAQGNGVQLGRTQHMTDPRIAQRAAERDADYARQLLQQRDTDVLAGRQLAESLAHFARLVPKLPCPVKALPHDVAMALYWAVAVSARRHYEVLPAPKMPVDQVAAIAKRYADHQAALGYSARQVAGESHSTEAPA